MTDEKQSYESKFSTDSVQEPILIYELSPLQSLINILGLSTLSKDIRTILDVVKLTERGFPIEILKRLQKHTKFTNREMGNALDMSESTLQRRLKSKDALDKKQSESAVQLATVWAKGLQVFQNEDDFRLWLQTKNRALGDNKPMSLMGSSIGREEIKNLLGRIEWGIYS